MNFIPVLMTAMSKSDVANATDFWTAQFSSFTPATVLLTLAFALITGVLISLVLFAVLLWTCWKTAPMGYLCGGVALVAGFLKYRKIVQYNSLTVKRFRNTYKDQMNVTKFNKFVDTHF